MELYLLDVIQHIANIVVLYLTLRALLYNPVRKFMLERSAREEAKQKELAAKLEEANALIAQNQQQIREAQEQAQQLISNKTAYAEQLAEKTITDAQEEAKHLLEEARQHIAEAEQKAQGQMVEQAADLAVELAQQLLQREISKEDNQKLIESYFSKVG